MKKKWLYGEGLREVSIRGKDKGKGGQKDKDEVKNIEEKSAFLML
jgi:uncharacterized protein (UPF0248 family)